MDIQERFSKITTFVFDIDGVLTDGTVLLLENGIQARRMNIKDGYALQLAVKKEYRVCAVSGADSPLVIPRLHKLGIKEVALAVTDKKEWLEKMMITHGLRTEEVLYMGDDMPDLPAMTIAGLPACPADAVTEIREAAAYISPFTGGMGCVRDVIEKALKGNGHWDDTSVTSS